jgi:hypothetical protein
MKILTLTLIAVLLLIPALMAGEQTCPANRAAEEGHKAFETFHGIMAPAWHTAWPDKDYDALLAAGPQFKEAFAGIAKLEPKFKTKTRETQFTELRQQFAEIVGEYVKAAEAGDKEKVYNLMPDLHDAFEHTASSLLPVHYPEFEGLVITFNLINETHLPKDNMEGITGSTETLMSKIDSLSEKTIPEELLEHKKEIMVEFATMKDLISKMKECCENKKMDQYKEHAAALEKEINSFIKAYI